MDPEGFNWGVTLFLFKGEYYSYNFSLYQYTCQILFQSDIIYYIIYKFIFYI